jgi:hypothetical protein
LSPDESIVTIAGVVIGPVLWAVWLFRLSRVQTLRRRPVGVNAIGLALVACAGLLFTVLKTSASFDVVDAPVYLFMYGVVGLAWLRVVELIFAFLGLSIRDDVVERSNRAAVPAVVGGMVAVTLCYSGGNIGDGPGWWVVLFSAALATAGLIVAWLALAHLTNVVDAVTIDRDTAAGLRLGAFLIACGIVLGRGVAGDWISAAATLSDFVVSLPAVAVIVAIAALIESRSRLTAQRPRAPLLESGVLPAVVYLLIAIAAVVPLGWPV